MNTKLKLSSREQKLFFLIIFCLIAYLAFQVIRPYLATITFAVITVSIYYPIYSRILKLTRRESIATTISLFLVLLTFIIPLTILLRITYKQVLTLYNDFDLFLKGNSFAVDDAVNAINKLLDKFPYIDSTITMDQLRQHTERIFNNIVQPGISAIIKNSLNIGMSVANSFTKFVVYIILVSGLFPLFSNIKDTIKKLSPFDEKIDDLYIERVLAMGGAIVKGSFVVATLQGMVSAIVLHLAGVPYSIFWAIFLSFLSIIPLGAGIITIPIGIFIALTGNTLMGIIIILNHLIIVTNIDNFLRPRLTSKDGELHPLLVLIGVLGGISLFGFMGVIYGPIILIFLNTTLEIYLKYYKAS